MHVDPGEDAMLGGEATWLGSGEGAGSGESILSGEKESK